MAIIGSQVSVGASATLLIDGTDGTAGSPLPSVVTNHDTSTSVFLGGSTVDSTGYELPAGTSVNVAVLGGDKLYGYAASTVRVDLLRVGV